MTTATMKGAAGHLYVFDFDNLKSACDWVDAAFYDAHDALDILPYSTRFMIERYTWDGCEITGTSFETLGEAFEFEALVAADSCRPYMLFDARGVKLFEVTAAMLAKPVAELRIIGR